MRLRNGKASVGLWALFAACTPVTTRPPFPPYPEAPTATLNARPSRVVSEAQVWLAALPAPPPLAVASPLDGYLETGWFEASDSAAAPQRVKLRVWADPDAPNKSRVTVEAVYRPVEDPSRPPRDLERPALAGTAGQRIVGRMFGALKEKLGETAY